MGGILWLNGVCVCKRLDFCMDVIYARFSEVLVISVVNKGMSVECEQA